MNKTLKKTLSIILSILMIVTSVPFAFAAGDGVPLTIDITDKSDVSIGNGQTYYDEDGYIITGTNKDLIVNVYEEGNFVFRNASFKSFWLSGGDYEVTITLEGDNYLGDTEGYYCGIYFSYQHLIIEGGENDTLNFNGKAGAISTSGSSGTCTVNGGKINAVTETDQNYSTIYSFGGFIMNGGEVTLSNNHYEVVGCPVTLNGGVLNVIGTSTDCAAVDNKITVEKGALLTVSSAYGILSDWYGTDIVVADDAEENTLLFAKYNTEDEFAPVYDIKSALDGKTYAEIKADTHNHSFTNDECVCGFVCEHTDREDGFCTVCKRYIYEITHQPTLEAPYVKLNNDADALYQWYTATDKVAEVIDGNEIVDKKENTYYEEETGWNGTWYDGVYVEYFDIYLKAGQKLTLIPDAYCMELAIYSLVEFITVESQECEAGTELTYIAENDGWYSIFAYTESSDHPRLRAYADAYDYTEIENETSARLEIVEIGKKYACKVTYGDGKTEMSDVFEYAYAITHQPTSGEPYVELNDDTDASYQWYEVERSDSEITDENADTVVYDWGESSYDKETGWTGVAYEENITGQDFFTVALKAGETVTVELTGDFTEGVGLWDYNINDGIWIDAEEGVSSYEITVGADGDYTFYTVVNSGVVTVKAYAGATNYTAIEGEASAEIKNPEIGKRYACEVTYGNGTTEMTDVLKYSYAITHQPTSEEPYVETNDSKATYQWYTVEGDCSKVTDENATVFTPEIIGAPAEFFDAPASYNASAGWTPATITSQEGLAQYYFIIEMKAGEKINFELSSAPQDAVFTNIETSNNGTFTLDGNKASATATEDGNYCLAVLGTSVITVKAYIGDVSYAEVKGQTTDTLTTTALDKYACKVTFADGTTEMSDAFEVTKLHTCDFSGEWKYDADKHWKECACGLLSEEGTHTGGEATCIAKAVCETCGEEYGEVDSDAHDIVIDEAVAPKCGETGLTEGQHCSRCDAMTIIQEVVPALTHKDDDGDYLCDHGCGTQISSGSNGGTGEAETPDGPEQPEEDGTICEHCGGNHSNPITRIFCRITQFFLRLFTFLGYWE